MKNKRPEDNFYIRMATPADAHAISKVLFESFLQFKNLYTEKAFEATTISPDEVKKRMSEGPIWIATKDDEIVGTVAIATKEQGLYIRGMAVLPKARGLKIGRKLLEQIMKYAEETHVKRLFLYTTPYLPAAIHLYESFGFTQSSDVDDSFFGTPGFEMEKWLA
ncbi:MAG: GNAT family N-acetyltransferase [Chitinophagaceae bacterium]|nr:GNAT family N-acetyltransferase [Chitinophagaceae bacterium]